MNEIENDHRITVESDAIDKHIEELRAAQKDLRQATETLEKATMTLNGALQPLNPLLIIPTNIVTGINNAIVKAQENTEYKVSIAQEDMELFDEKLTSRFSHGRDSDEATFWEASSGNGIPWAQNFIYSQPKQGFWISEFLGKSFSWVMLACFLITFIAYHLKTRP